MASRVIVRSGDLSSIILSLLTDVFLVGVSIVVNKIPTEGAGKFTNLNCTSRVSNGG